jgi:hypothetical protein
MPKSDRAWLRRDRSGALRQTLSELIATGGLLRAETERIVDPESLEEFRLRHRDWILSGMRFLGSEFEQECVTEFMSLKLPPIESSDPAGGARIAEHATRNAVEYLRGLLATLARDDGKDASGPAHLSSGKSTSVNPTAHRAPPLTSLLASGQALLRAARLVGDNQDADQWALRRATWISEARAIITNQIPVEAAQQFRRASEAHILEPDGWRARLRAETESVEDSLEAIASIRELVDDRHGFRAREV